jgi:serine/threonine-protein kinase
MSPEQLSGDAVDGRSDLYSLALVFFRTLSGKLPFEADTAQEMMIKRLTDEPVKLAEARPDLTFPPGLQAVFDTALARNPMVRYQTVAKFAADVGLVAGHAAPAVVAQTRAPADAEGKTQLLDSPAPKKRSFVPMVAGVVLVLVVGGAWMALNGGNRTTDNPVDTSRVSRDTAKTTQPAQNTGRESSRPPAAPPAAPRAAPVGIDPARASQILDDLIESTPAVIRDSAAKVYYTTAVASGDRAFAACMVAQAEQSLGNRTAAVQWANRGQVINAGLKSCQDVLQGGGS